MQDGIEDGSGRVALERKTASSHFVEDDAEGEEVSAGVEFLAKGLFGRHVGDSAEGGAGAGEMSGVGSERSLVAISGGRFCGGKFGEAEIEDFGVAASGDEDVGGLDVAVDDAFGVGGIESFGDLNGSVEETLEFNWLAIFDPQAPGWPGDSETVEETRANADAVAGHGINDVVDHYAAIVQGLSEPPVLVGHSFGGLIVQRLIGQGLGAAGVAIDPAPIKGVLVLPISALKVASIALKSPSNKNKAVSLTAEQFLFGFGNAIPGDESDELFERWTIPSPGKPLFEAAFANFAPKSPARVNTHNGTRAPLLITAGGQDHTVPAAISRSTKKLYRHTSAVTDLREFPDRGHSLTIDHGWEEVADATLEWLAKQLA